MKNFKRIETFNYKNNYFKIFVDKNDSVWDILESKVLSWKMSDNGKKRIPDQIQTTRNIYFFERIKGNPFSIAKNKIITELDYQFI